MSDYPEEAGRRYSDEMLFRLDEQIKLHLLWSEKQTTAFDKRIQHLEEWRMSIEKPVHYAGMLIIGLVLAFVSAVGTWVWKVLTRIHFS